MLTKISPSMQDYLKAVFLLASDGAPGGGAPVQVSTTAVAQHMAVSTASATNMLKRLDSMGLVTYVPYKGAALTEPGRKMALEVVRHHRLLETYLAEALGVPWDEVHREAEVLEHVLSEELEDRISAQLGDPVADPHGHPIPAKDGTMPSPSGRRLWATRDGEVVSVQGVPDMEADVLRYLAASGIRPGATVNVLGRGPVGGPLFVRVEGRDRALSKELANAIWVR